VYTDHSAVLAILNTSSPSGKHACWWSKVYGAGIKKLDIIHCAGKANTNADALSRNPQSAAPNEGISENELQVAVINTEPISNIYTILQANPTADSSTSFRLEQEKDSYHRDIIQFLEAGTIPVDPTQARKIVIQQSLFTIIDRTLFCGSQKRSLHKDSCSTAFETYNFGGG